MQTNWFLIACLKINLPIKYSLTYIYIYISGHNVIVIFIGNEHGNLLQILDEAVCISHSANTLAKGKKLTVLPLAMGR